MLTAISAGERILATPEAKGICPVCDAELIPKCGEIKAWHWAHKSLRDCDTWAEPEGDWHYGWKKLAGLENTEVVIKKDDRVHRADIKTPGGLVIELQHSPLSTADVRDREDFYKNMIWVVDGDEVCPNMALDQYVSKTDSLYFRHGEIKKSWVNEISKPLYIHFSHKYYDTYYYYNEYTMIYNTLHKRLRKAPVNGAPRELKDFLLRISGRYCEVIPSRIDFFKRFGPFYAGYGLSMPNKAKSLFNF